jgi:hypothetical protein
MNIAIPKNTKLGEGFSKQEIRRSTEHPGRRTDGSQSAASWISDLGILRKSILLCGWCKVKFNPRKARYRKFYSPDWTGKTDGYLTHGKCDGCKNETINTPGGGTLFTPEEVYNLTCVDPVEQRRKARLKWRAQNAWGVVQRINSGSRRPNEAAAGRQ